MSTARKHREGETFLGINLMMDPSVAIVRDGQVIAFSEEERHVRIKHAAGLYPSRALQYCLKTAGCRLSDVAAVGINWDLDAYTDGRMKEFYHQMRKEHPVDEKTIRWQDSRLKLRNLDSYRESHESEWRRIYGTIPFPKIYTMPHHYTHAYHAFSQSPFDRAVCVTVDGSGDRSCTIVWRCDGEKVEAIYELNMPHSLGWVYAAMTEYLGFRAYDGEYKVMGLAAYGRPDPEMREKVAKIVHQASDGIGYEVDGTYIHYGPHTYSPRFTDKLVDLLGRPPRLSSEKITDWHENLSYAVQEALEEHVSRLVKWAIGKTGISNVCVGGGVGLNVKMNSKLFELGEVDDLFAHPLCGDSGAAVGAALLACHEHTQATPERLTTLAIGHEERTEDIEQILEVARIKYEKPADLCAVVADELAKGRIVGWFQGRMEAGPRALGCRSILADPRDTSNRDKVNAIIKFREYWRPFCPSIMAEHMDRYFDAYTEAPFMIMAFQANDRLKEDAPAIVHVDGTARVQMVRQEVAPRYHELLEAFNTRTGVPVLLNTSFNVKGEPIVCNTQDALRTFWSTGLEVLAIGDFIIRKPILG